MEIENYKFGKIDNQLPRESTFRVQSDRPEAAAAQQTQPLQILPLNILHLPRFRLAKAHRYPTLPPPTSGGLRFLDL